MLFPRTSHKTAPKLEDFYHEKQLGKGSYGQVSKYIHKQTLLPYAIKRISLKDRSQRDILLIQKQLQILYRIKNRYIVELIDHFEDVQNKVIYLIMQYIEGYDLHKGVFGQKQRLQVTEVATIIYQLAAGLHELHLNNIIHRDLKLQNVIYLPSKSIKLVDLGCSNYYGEDKQRFTEIGTQIYFSPELINGDVQDDRLDVWCLGVMMYELLFLLSPFRGSDIKSKIKKLQYEIPATHSNDKQLIDLFSKIFCYKNKRMRARDVMNHSWIQKNFKKQFISIDGEKQFKDKDKVILYKKFLLEEIQNCEQDIERIKRQNEELAKKLKQHSFQEQDVF